MTLAECWEASAGLPPELARVIEPLAGPAKLLLAIPEHKVALPGGGSASRSDVSALIRGRDRVIARMVEGKVDERFGPTLGEWLRDASPGKRTRLSHIKSLLGLPPDLNPDLRYQLLHRAAAAVIEAERFMSGAAALIVHSFAPDRRWLPDFQAFARLFSAEVTPGAGAEIRLPSGLPLYLGWADGEQRFRRA